MVANCSGEKVKPPAGGAVNDGGGRVAPNPVDGGRVAPKSAGRLRGAEAEREDPKSAGRLGRDTAGRAVSRPVDSGREIGADRGKDERLAPKSAGRVVAGSAAGRDEKALTEGSGSAVVERGRELNEGAKDGTKGVAKGRVDGAKLGNAVAKDGNARGVEKADGSRGAAGRETAGKEAGRDAAQSGVEKPVERNAILVAEENTTKEGKSKQTNKKNKRLSSFL